MSEMAIFWPEVEQFLTRGLADLSCGMWLILDQALIQISWSFRPK